MSYSSYPDGVTQRDFDELDFDDNDPACPECGGVNICACEDDDYPEPYGHYVMRGDTE